MDAVDTIDSSSKELPILYPFAFKNVKAIPPPIIIEFALSKKDSINPSFDPIFAPPKISVKGRLGRFIAALKYCISRSTNNPIPLCLNWAGTPTLDACDRWAVPKASLI